MGLPADRATDVLSLGREQRRAQRQRVFGRLWSETASYIRRATPAVKKKFHEIFS